MCARAPHHVPSLPLVRVWRAPCDCCHAFACTFIITNRRNTPIKNHTHAFLTTKIHSHVHSHTQVCACLSAPIPSSMASLAAAVHAAPSELGPVYTRELLLIMGLPAQTGNALGAAQPDKRTAKAAAESKKEGKRSEGSDTRGKHALALQLPLAHACFEAHAQLSTPTAAAETTHQPSSLPLTPDLLTLCSSYRGPLLAFAQRKRRKASSAAVQSPGSAGGRFCVLCFEASPCWSCVNRMSSVRISFTSNTHQRTRSHT